VWRSALLSVVAILGADPTRRLGVGPDVAGIVDNVAPDVRDFTVGTPVAALHFSQAGLLLQVLHRWGAC
jgi:NADPH:quinone reductase-like Zn-dependent oxidoreductase